MAGIGIRGRVRVGAIGSGVIAAGERLVVLVAASAHGRGLRVVRWAYVVRSTRGERPSTCRHFRVGEGSVAVGALLTAEESAPAAARRVVVRRAGSEALLLLVVTGKSHLDEGGKEEQDGSGDGDGKASRIHLACAAERHGVGVLLLAGCIVEPLLGAALTIAQRCPDEAAAAVRAISGEDGNGNEGAAEEQIKDNGQQGKEGLAAEEACQQDGKDGVQDGSTRHALNSFDPCVDGQVTVRERGEEVRVDA